MAKTIISAIVIKHSIPVSLHLSLWYVVMILYSNIHVIDIMMFHWDSIEQYDGVEKGLDHILTYSILSYSILSYPIVSYRIVSNCFGWEWFSWLNETGQVFTWRQQQQQELSNCDVSLIVSLECVHGLSIYFRCKLIIMILVVGPVIDSSFCSCFSLFFMIIMVKESVFSLSLSLSPSEVKFSIFDIFSQNSHLKWWPYLRGKMDLGSIFSGLNTEEKQKREKGKEKVNSINKSFSFEFWIKDNNKLINTHKRIIKIY